MLLSAREIPSMLNLTKILHFEERTKRYVITGNFYKSDVMFMTRFAFAIRYSRLELFKPDICMWMITDHYTTAVLQHGWLYYISIGACSIEVRE